MEDALTLGVVFFGFYSIIKILSEHFLKRKIINSGHLDKADILGSNDFKTNTELQKYPSLKWGLVAFFAGLGFITMTIINQHISFKSLYFREIFFIGVILTFISLGFLIYFLIVMRKK